MNKDRRERINAARELLEQAQTAFEYIRDEEQEAFDNLPESLQCSERGYTMDTNVSTLDEVVEGISDVLDKLDEIE